MSERYTVTASSLGSYFGVGFNDPMTQLQYDLGLEENTFDEDSRKRMLLGTLLEDSVLNYFEDELDVKITGRNEEKITGFDGMMRMIIDGECIYNGEPTIVECKVSNSSYGPFTNNVGYYLQVQAYMKEKGYKQALLVGLYMGKPLWKLIKIDTEVCEDIKTMITSVYSILNGIASEEEFPWYIVEHYSKSTPLTLLTEFDDGDLSLVDEYYTLSQQMKELKNRQDDIKAVLQNKYEDVKYVDTDTGLSMTVSSYERAGGFDESELSMAFPDIDLNKFRKPSSRVQRLSITKKKKK